MKIQYEIKPEDYSKVIYGDSVSSETPVMIKYSFSNKLIIDKISSINRYSNSKWKPYVGFKMFDYLAQKEYATSCMDIFTHKGWANIQKVIRHKTNKKMYRIYTNVGLIEVTEDHSLIDKDGNKLKPCDVEIRKTVLLYDESVYNFGCISCEKIQPKVFEKFEKQLDAMKYFFALKNTGVNVTIKFTRGFYVITSNQDKNFPLGTVLRIEPIVFYNDYVYDIQTKHGTFQAGIGSLIVKNTDSCMVELKTKTYELFRSKLDLYKDYVELPPDIKEELETLKTKVLEESFRVGKQIAKEITENLFKYPIELEFEKVYHPYIILTKKRYIGNYYSKSPYKIDKVENKGIVLSRRDNAEILKKTYLEVMNPLLKEGSRGLKLSIKLLKDKLTQLKNNDVRIEDLIITKTLAKGYGKQHITRTNEVCEGCSECKNGIILGPNDYKQMNSPHISLAVKIRNRDRGSAPRINDRIDYVIINLPDKPKAALYEKAEEPNTVIEKNLPIDYLYYMENQLKKPVCELLSLVVEKPEAIFEEFTKDMKPVKAPKAQKKLKEANQPSILKWIGKGP